MVSQPREIAVGDHVRVCSGTFRGWFGYAKCVNRTTIGTFVDVSLVDRQAGELNFKVHDLQIMVPCLMPVQAK